METYRVGVNRYGPFNDGRTVCDVIHVVDGKVFFQDACHVRRTLDGETIKPAGAVDLDQCEEISPERFPALGKLQGWGAVINTIRLRSDAGWKGHNMVVGQSGPIGNTDAIHRWRQQFGARNSIAMCCDGEGCAPRNGKHTLEGEVPPCITGERAPRLDTLRNVPGQAWYVACVPAL